MTTPIHDLLVRQQERSLRAQGYTVKACELGIPFVPDVYAEGHYTKEKIFVEIDYKHPTSRNKLSLLRRYGKVIVFHVDGKFTKRYTWKQLLPKEEVS